MFKRILILAPHTDDGELGCGGTMARFVSEGKTVFQAAFSTAARSLPTGLPQDTLDMEFRAASTVLGISAENLIVLDYPVREFPAYRQEILEQLMILRRELEPDLVLLPAPEDIHQDHNTVAMEGIRAFKQITVFGYELPWNNLTFNNSGFISFNESCLEKKVQALACYRSQAHRPYSEKDYIIGQARVRGTQIGASFAEMFRVVRMVIS